jgi:hypothetical protein
MWLGRRTEKPFPAEGAEGRRAAEKKRKKNPDPPVGSNAAIGLTKLECLLRKPGNTWNDIAIAFSACSAHLRASAVKVFLAPG